MRTCIIIGLSLLVSFLTGAELSLNSYEIVTPDQPAEVEKSAAGELKNYLGKITGTEFKVSAESAHSGELPAIYVGNTRAFANAFPGVDLTALPMDTIILKSKNGDLYLTGHPQRGALYAVYTLLEDFAGCRWWTSTEEFVPSKPELKIAVPDIQYSPKLIYREVWYRDTNFPEDKAFPVRLKLNGDHHKNPPALGGHYQILGWCHTFFRLLPPEKYFAAHPEWYSEIDGKRVHQRAQLCLTNDEMRHELTKNALEWIRQNPRAGMISISQNDWAGNCACVDCRKIETEEGSPAGLMLRFVNAVAADIGAEYPDFLVETLAYQYTRQAPRTVRPAKNVIIRLCSIEASVSQTLESGAQNAAFRKDIQDWSRIADKLYIWDYVGNFRNYLLPHPNYHVMAPNVRFYVRHHAVSVFEQGDGGSSIGDFVRPRAWLLARLLWNPEADEKALFREFFDGYYGAAGPYLLQYLDFLTRKVVSSGAYIGCMEPGVDNWLAPKDLIQAYELFGKAEKAVAGDPALFDRVRRERLTLDNAYLSAVPEMTRLGLKLPKDPEALVDEFITLAERWKAGQYRENISFGQYGKELKKMIAAQAAPPENCRNLPPERWMDYQEKQLSLSMVDGSVALVDDPLASNKIAMKMPGNKNWWPIQLKFNNRDHSNYKWGVYMALRAEAASTQGNAVSTGIYDNNAKKYLVQLAVPLKDLSPDKYKIIKIGSISKPVEGQYVWIATPNRPLNEVAAVYVDRVYLIREN